MTERGIRHHLAHLAPNGIIAINFELNTFEMAPLHRGMAKLFGLEVRWIETQSEDKDGCEEPISGRSIRKKRVFSKSSA